MRLDLYISRRFIWSFCLIFSVFLGIVLLIDMVEQLRRFDSEALGAAEAFRLALLNSPTAMYRMLPLLVILATIMLFLGLARTSELVVTRASGRSALRSLISPVVTALMLGIIGVSVFNPIAAGTAKQYELVAARYANTGASVTSVSNEGLWLRQGSPDSQVVIRATRSNMDGTQFLGVTFYAFDGDGKPTYRVNAREALLQPGAWVLKEAKRWDFTQGGNAEGAATLHDNLEIPSNLTQDQIQDSFGDPSAIPIWKLPEFISQLENAGFSGVRHRVWLHMELANPVLLAAMVLIGAGFTMRHTRFGRTGILVLFAVLSGFGIYFLRNFAQVLGENDQIPVFAAAWAPPLAGIFLSLGLLFHTEDG